MTSDFCIEALNEAITKYGAPEIFNSDQGSQFTSHDFTQVLKGHKIKISLGGKERWSDNVSVERLWKSVKYEHVYLHAYESVADARSKLGNTLSFSTAGARTLRLTAKRPTWSTSKHNLNRRPLDAEPGYPLQGSHLKTKNSVLTNGATSK